MTDDTREPSPWRPATQLVRGGTRRSQFSETCEAMYMTSGYVYGSAEEAEGAFVTDGTRFVYSRFANPTVEMFQDRLALLEGARFCRATASGMAAVYAALTSLVKAGDRIVASRALFGSCSYIIGDLLPRFGVGFEFVDGTDIAQWERALSTPAAAVFLESPANPTLEIIDIPRVAELAHAAGAKVVVDNVFATPLLQKPLALGADVVVYSTTKHIDGQGRSLGGAILTDDEAYVNEGVGIFLRHTGPAMSPFNAWLLLKGMETLDLRVRQHCANAAKVAAFLEGRAGANRVLYPGLESHPQHALAAAQMPGGGTMVAFEAGRTKEDAFRFLNALSIIDISNNLGDSKSLITHPATTTHQRLTDEQRAALGITPAMVRLSVGLEDADDLIEDLDRALSVLG